MKKWRKSYLCKALFVGKLSLVLLLLFTAGKMLLFPAHLRMSLPPLSAVAQDKVRTPDDSIPNDFLSNDYSEIVKRNPFGLSDVPLTSKNNSSGSESSPSDELALTLLGTISGSPPIARAIIKNLKTGGLDLYRVGQTLENARIESIEPDAVTLLHNGQKKVLRLNLWLGNTLHPAGNNDSNALTPSAGSVDASEKILEAELPSQQNIAPVRSRSSPMETILAEAVIEPYVINNVTEGLMITGIENLKAANDLGLKNGDVIRSVNGHRLAGRQTAFQVFKKAMSGQSVGLELMRDGKTKKLSFSLR